MKHSTQTIPCSTCRGTGQRLPARPFVVFLNDEDLSPGAHKGQRSIVVLAQDGVEAREMVEDATRQYALEVRPL